MPSAHRTEARRGDWAGRNLVILGLLTVFAFLILGYHPGLEDDAFYLAAIKRNLNPALFPHDADFFRVQFQATIFDKLISLSVRLTHLPIGLSTLLWQVGAIFFVLHGCRRIGRRCFAEPPAQWASVALVAGLLSMPLPGIGINLADQYLHPRTLATALILAAIVAVLDRRWWAAGILLAIAFSVHAIMACFGISFCAFLFWNLNESASEHHPLPIGVAMLVPLGWLFEPASEAWRRAAATRSFYFVAHWQWYEWIGVFAPLLLLYAYQWFTQRQEERRQITQESVPLRAVVMSLLYFGGFQTIVGLAIMLPPGLERLRPFEPMRYLHLLYLLFFLIVGGLLGRQVLRNKVYRWLLLLVPLSAGMIYAQLKMFPHSSHLEWPGTSSRNAWVQAFDWIRNNTPVDSLFALNPHYLQQPGEDFHGFRALAERSVLADYEKDAGMAARVPSLAPRWWKEVSATTGWENFQTSDFERLKKEFGANWVVISPGQIQSAAMSCPYQNQRVLVCRLY